jgi:hypothetical protein
MCLSSQEGVGEQSTLLPEFFYYHKIDLDSDEFSAFMNSQISFVEHRNSYNMSDIFLQLLPTNLTETFCTDVSTSEKNCKLFCSQAIWLSLRKLGKPSGALHQRAPVRAPPKRRCHQAALRRNSARFKVKMRGAAASRLGDGAQPCIVLVCLYVDDALIAYSSKSALQAMRRALAGAHSAFLTFIGLHIPLRTTRDFLTEDRMPFPHILCKRHHVTWILIFSVAFCFLYSFPSSSVLKLLTLMFRNSTYTYQSL